MEEGEIVDVGKHNDRRGSPQIDQFKPMATEYAPMALKTSMGVGKGSR